MTFADEELISDEEWERYAKAKPTTFPLCQYSPGLQVSSNDDHSGIVLLGDSAHAFPPDIGQGINAGLKDVVQFHKSLKKVQAQAQIRRDDETTTTKDGKGPTGNGTLGDALRAHERVQGPETKALIRIARFGFPYQYDLPYPMLKLRRTMWAMNIALRLLLNKVSFGIIPKAMIMNMANAKLSYRQVARRSDLTTLVLTLMSLKILFTCVTSTWPRALGLLFGLSLAF